MKPKLLVTGASGFLGFHLCRMAVAHYEVHGLYHGHARAYPEVKMHRCDVSHYVDLGNLIEEIQPDAVVHLAAISDTKTCEQEPERSETLNVDATVNLGGICADWNLPMVFASTDLVFDGLKGNYVETDAVNPVNRYGAQKALAEQQLMAVYPGALTVRLSMMFGEAEASERNFLQQLLGKLRKGESMSLFYDEYRNACSAESAVKGILQMIGQQQGILHLAGPEKLSRLAFGQMVARAFGLNESLLQSCSSDEVNTGSPRPKDVSLNMQKAFTLGYRPDTVPVALEKLAGKG